MGALPRGWLRPGPEGAALSPRHPTAARPVPCRCRRPLTAPVPRPEPPPAARPGRGAEQGALPASLCRRRRRWCIIPRRRFPAPSPPGKAAGSPARLPRPAASPRRPFPCRRSHSSPARSARGRRRLPEPDPPPAVTGAPSPIAPPPPSPSPLPPAPGPSSRH